MSRKITKSAQLAIKDILEELTMCNSFDDVWKVYYDMMIKYGLHEDPFTRFPVTDEEYGESCIEYNRQLMEEKYDYWE